MQVLCIMIEQLHVPASLPASTLEALARLESSLSALYAANTDKHLAVQLVLCFLSLIQHAHGSVDRAVAFVQEAHEDLGRREACHELVCVIVCVYVCINACECETLAYVTYVNAECILRFSFTPL